MKLMFKNIFRIICFVFFISSILTLFIYETLSLQLVFPVSGLEYFLRITTSFILCIVPAIAVLYFRSNYKNKYVYSFLLTIFCVYYFVLFLLFIYFNTTTNFFGINFLLDNFEEAIFTVKSIFGTARLFFILSLFLFFVISFIITANFIKLSDSKILNIFKKIIANLFILFIIFASLEFYFHYEKPLLLDFMDNIFINKDVVYQEYQTDYSTIVDRYFNFKLEEFNLEKVQENLPDIYFIHLESVSGDFMDKYIIPNFDKYSKENGVVFDNFYSNSIQTLRSQESILCALPPSLGGYFQNKFDSKRLLCIPKILSHYGYKTLFFKDHDLNFSKTGKFMSDIGFGELHSSDIMKEGDPYYKWGFREDVFYRRVYEYLENYREHRKFVYIAISATNHLPFNVQEEFNDLPIKQVKTFTDKLKNTTYVQDKYLKVILDELKNDKKEKYIFIFGDHPWPTNYHKNNYFNEKFAYRENFHTVFSVLHFGEGESLLNFGDKIEDSYNQIDFLKSILDLLKIKNSNKYLGNSFFEDLLKENETQTMQNCSISVQPYSNRYISLFYANKHYIYDIKNKESYYFDILKNKYETQQHNISQNDFLGFYNKCKKLIGY